MPSGVIVGIRSDRLYTIAVCKGVLIIRTFKHDGTAINVGLNSFLYFAQLNFR